MSITHKKYLPMDYTVHHRTEHENVAYGSLKSEGNGLYWKKCNNRSKFSDPPCVSLKLQFNASF